MSPIEGWHDFYVITGGAAAALTGLMFVVITFISSLGRRPPRDGAGVYTTPTIVHFAATILIAALLTAPWPTLWEAALPVGIVGAIGLIYGAVVLRRTIGTWRNYGGSYQPVLEDWLCHVVLPPVAYALLIVAAIFLPQHATPALFGVAAVSVFFLILGVHNAWDIITYITFENAQAALEGADGAAPDERPQAG